ncbi:MAG: hypothetical protein QM813_09380 [Verrucomicrobiota bacterium]
MMQLPPQFDGFVLIAGEHEGLTWFVAHNKMCYRCGYVLVPPEHPWFGRLYEEIEADVHGGLTFAGPAGTWAWCVGFDCAHSGDAPDPDLPHYADMPLRFIFGQDGVIRSTEYVEAECLKLCKQAALAQA